MAQKYTVVYFFENQKPGYNFSSKAWPLHSTLLDIFTLNKPLEALGKHMKKVAVSCSPFTIKADKDTMFGPAKDIPVTLLSRNTEIVHLHTKLLEAAEGCSATFDNPQYTGKGFVPHATVQQNSRLVLGQSYRISSVSLIDMYPDRAISRRKIIETYHLMGLQN